MGLLDEAIREHLELKRRRGADTTEVARQEKEAFGPTVTEAPRAEAPAADPPEAPEAPTRLHVADPPADELEPEIDPPRPHGDPADSFPHAPAPVAEPEPEPLAPPEPEPEPEPVRDEPPAQSASQPTREFDLDEVRAATGAEPETVPAEEEPEGEDVLEETPEFLQETPEHDRLWFEQRPPRDFDF